MARFEMSGGAKFWYYFINIFTFASLYFIKVAVMKAFEDMQNKARH
ncbi:MAG TPA: hypothetical protein VL989_01410 [Candidatus Sulfotelmatobacter sp.]|nr:hypothetical protein [Candidatus Sulfotelmatobacter sp.]